MSFVIRDGKSKDGYRYVVNSGDAVELVDPRGRRASFKVVFMLGISDKVAWRHVGQEMCDRADDGTWDPGPEVGEPIEDEEFMPAGSYILLHAARSNPGTCAMLIPEPVSRPRTRRSAVRKAGNRRTPARR